MLLRMDGTVLLSQRDAMWNQGIRLAKCTITSTLMSKCAQVGNSLSVSCILSCLCLCVCVCVCECVCVLPPWLSWLLIHADYDHLPPIMFTAPPSLLRFLIHFMLSCCFSRSSVLQSFTVVQCIIPCSTVCSCIIRCHSLSHAPRD